MSATESASHYAFVVGARRTAATLGRWQKDPWPALRPWVGGSAAAAIALLCAVALVAHLATPSPTQIEKPPFATGDLLDVASIFGHNLLVLALHAMACVAGFIAGSSLPIQAEHHRGLSRRVHEHGGRLAIFFVIAATTFSLSAQAYVLGHQAANAAAALSVDPAVLLLTLCPYAIPELMALFLPLAAWIIASRRGEWDQLLAATLVTSAIAIPVLLVTASAEVYIAPHAIGAVLVPLSKALSFV